MVNPLSVAPLRIARPSRDLEAACRYWHEGLGMQVLWRTDAAALHDGEHELVMLGFPGAAWHLELVLTRDAPAPTPTAEDLLVLYLDGPVPDDVVRRVCDCGGRRVEAANPYWETWGITLEDPDGYRLVLSTRGWAVG